MVHKEGGGVPTQGQNQNWLPNPCLLGVPVEGAKIRSGDITHASLGGQKWVDWLHNPCLLAGP